MAHAVIKTRTGEDNPDAALIRYCAALVAMEAQWRLECEYCTDGGEPDQPAGYDELIGIINRTPARTEAGNRAKLAAVVAFYAPDFDASLGADHMMWDAIKALALPVASMEAILKGATGIT